MLIKVVKRRGREGPETIRMAAIFLATVASPISAIPPSIHTLKPSTMVNQNSVRLPFLVKILTVSM
jgi:hypothetical protein